MGNGVEVRKHMASQGQQAAGVASTVGTKQGAWKQGRLTQGVYPVPGLTRKPTVHSECRYNVGSECSPWVDSEYSLTAELEYSLTVDSDCRPTVVSEHRFIVVHRVDPCGFRA